MDQKTEAEIVIRVLKGERQAYALLVEEYKNPIYNLAYRMTNTSQDAHVYDMQGDEFEQKNAYFQSHPGKVVLQG